MSSQAQPDLSPLLRGLAITHPVIGFYDAPDPTPFVPLVEPRGRECVFHYRRAWCEGKTLHLTKEKHGCGASHLLGVDVRPREEMIDFLWGEEGLRATRDLMGEWLDVAPRYQPVHEHLLIGPLAPGQYQYLRTATFYVNPDQLSVLAVGATYFHRPGDPVPLISRFGSGCMQLTCLFDSLEIPQALIGATDHAARSHLEPWMLAFTVTKPMLELLSRWAADPRSSLHSRFMQSLLRARGGSLTAGEARDAKASPASGIGPEVVTS
jgi:hypothetical protein